VTVSQTPSMTSGSGAEAGPAMTKRRPATSALVSPTSPAVQPESVSAQVMSAYMGMWADLTDALATDNNHDPRLPAHASGRALSDLIEIVRLQTGQGYVSRGKPILSPSISSLTPTITPTQAVITDCLNDTQWPLYDVSTGKLASVDAGTTRFVRAIVTSTHGMWKVSQLATKGPGSC
jgi:hypothetical protein